MTIEDFPLRLSKLREQAGVSARDMSLSLAQNETYINSIENGKSFPSMTSFFVICDFLNISPSEFFDIENENPHIVKEIAEKSKSLTKEQAEIILYIIDRFIKSK